jgi:hypothetical protein
MSRVPLYGGWIFSGLVPQYWFPQTELVECGLIVGWYLHLDELSSRPVLGRYHHRRNLPLW